MSESDVLDTWEWFGQRTYHHSRFLPADLLAAKLARGVTISVCLPTRNEAKTVGAIVRSIRRNLMDRVPLVDEVVVIDSASADGTAEVASRAGAVVYQDADIVPEVPLSGGKGEALWRSLFVLSGDLVVFTDADVTNFKPHFVTGLLGPLLLEDGVSYVKGFYERPLRSGRKIQPAGGGRVTELVVRPLLNLFFPQLTAVVQPLSGEYAGTRQALEQVPFFTGYGVEFGLLVDLAERFGLRSIAQVDLERRVHRNQSVPELSRMAFGILQAAFKRLDSLGRVRLRSTMSTEFFQFQEMVRGYQRELSVIDVVERPPAVSLPRYRARRRSPVLAPG